MVKAATVARLAQDAKQDALIPVCYHKQQERARIILMQSSTSEAFLERWK